MKPAISETLKTSFHLTVERALEAASSSYEQALANQQRDIAEAVATKGHLADGYWKPAHRARLRYLSALALMEAVDEA